MARQDSWMDEARCAHFPGLGWLKDRHQTSPAETATMAVVCARCSVFADCDDFVAREKITGGFWAGEFRDGEQKRYGGAA